MPVTSSTETLTIQSGQGAYPVHFHSTVADLVVDSATASNAVVLADAHVAEVYGDALEPLLGKYPCYQAPALESEKTWAGVERMLLFLQKNGCNKGSKLIVVGGGIMQDIATFSTHVYYRGIPFEYVPTTLLSMADSCIGAKCGINFGSFKNQLGVFHSPCTVRICHRFLDTLSDAEVVSGYGEIIKLALTGSEQDYEQTEHAVDSAGFRCPELPALINMSLGVKKVVIEEDEYEIDLRRILNYGHTFGHALEAITTYAVPHGVGVAWGLDLANYISWRKGMLSEQWFQRIHGFLERHYTLPAAARVSADDLIAASRRDKKNIGSRLTMILLEKPGALKVVYMDYDDKLRTWINEYFELSHAFYRD